MVIGLILAFLFWTGNRTHRARAVPLDTREGVRRGGAGLRRRRQADHRPPHPAQLRRPDHVNTTLIVGAGDPRRGGALFLGSASSRRSRRSGCSRRRAGERPEHVAAVTFSGLAILIALCVNFFGDGLRDALDPTQRVRAERRRGARRPHEQRARCLTRPHDQRPHRRVQDRRRHREGGRRRATSSPRRGARHRRRVRLGQERLDAQRARAAPGAAGRIASGEAIFQGRDLWTWRRSSGSCAAAR